MRGWAMRPGFRSSMYAMSGSSSIYHLLYPDHAYTLCGFKVEKHDPQLPAKASLHVVEFVPPNRELCKQCDKMKRRRQAVADKQTGKAMIPKILLSRTAQSR